MGCGGSTPTREYQHLMENPYRILLAEGEDYTIPSVGQLLEEQGWECVRVAGCSQAVRHLTDGEFDVLVAGHGMAGHETRELARAARDTAPEVPVLVAAPLQDDDGNGRGAAPPDADGFVRRVRHAAKLGRLAIRHGDDYFRSLVQDVGDVLQVGLLALDSSSRISWMNLPLETYLGVSREEAFGRDYDSFLVDQLQHMMADPAAFVDAVTAARTAGDQRFECHVLSCDGREERWLEYQSHPVGGGLFAGGRLEHFTDITVRRRTEQSLRRREHILSAVAFASERFLQSGSWEEHIDAVLRRLGEATGVSAVYVLENRESQDGTQVTRLRHVWRETEDFPRDPGEGSRSIPLEREGVSHFAARLRQGEVVQVNLEDLTQEERDSGLFTGGGSVASVPILISGGWWGTISFDVWEHRRDWSAAELDALKAAASTLGAAIQHERSQREVQAAHERLELALNGADLALWDLNIQTNEAILSDRAAEMLGYAPETLGRSSAGWFRLVHPADRDRIKEATRAHVTGRAPIFEADFRVRASDGEWRWVHSRGRVVEYDDQGTPLRAAGTHLDVTARKEAEMALRESERRYRQIVETSLEGIVIYDAQGKVTFANGRLAALLGLDEGEIPGRSVFDLVAGLTREVVANQFHKRQLGLDSQYDLHARGMDGSDVWYIISSTPLFENGREFIGGLSMVTDITARKRAEEEAKAQRRQLVQTEKLASLGILVSGVAHEINNPNQLVLGNLSLLKDAYDGIIPILDKYHDETGPFLLGGLPYSQMRGEFAQMFAETRSGAVRIQRIVKELRDFARQGPTHNVEPLCLDDVMLSAVALTRNAVQSSTRRFSLSLHGSLPLIEGNAQHLEQVAINLIMNGCQALPGTDRGLTVSTGYDEENQRVVIRVTDQGVGMTQDVMQHLTDPFFTTKRDTGGTGLGLAISARIVSEHGGSMTFDSTPGRGTVASVLLPVRTDLGNGSHGD
jgi:PAS domain S-box-containing protein